MPRGDKFLSSLAFSGVVVYVAGESTREILGVEQVAFLVSDAWPPAVLFSSMWCVGGVRSQGTCLRARSADPHLVIATSSFGSYHLQRPEEGGWLHHLMRGIPQHSLSGVLA